MLSAASFIGGFFVDALAPCGMASACGGPTFKLSACIQGFQNADEGSVASSSSRGPKPRSRPFVTLSCGQRSKQTEVGDWADDERRFRFDEALTLEVTAESEVCVSLSCSQEYDLFVAALDLRPTRIGEASTCTKRAPRWAGCICRLRRRACQLHSRLQGHRCVAVLRAGWMTTRSP
mmetsp:Transcript_1401/g.5655  ORF Transcript_1401/g.5655 Transcript_1401/m.5655 type:complete len:177 (-) Transcript_1401:432-962(-)